MREEFHEGAGITLRAVVPDTTPRALVVHGMWPDPDRFTGAREALGAILYDRRGHGGSPAGHPYVGTTVEEQAQDAVHLLDALAAPPLTVAGEDLGALVALDLARRHAARVTGLVLVDPVLPQLLPDGAEWLRTLGDRRPPVPADIAACTSWAVTRRELRAISVPVLLATTPAATSYATRSADVLAGLLPGARRETAADLLGALNLVV